MFSRIFPLAAFAACLLAIAACSDSSAPPATANALAAPTPTAIPTHTPTLTAAPISTTASTPTAAPIARHTPHYEFEESFPPGFRPSQITLGDGYICGLDDDGRAVCVEGVADAREAVYQSASFSSISSGKLHVCGLGDGGAVSCWGSDEFGENDPPAGAFSALAAGKRHNSRCARTARRSAGDGTRAGAPLRRRTRVLSQSPPAGRTVAA